ncbi:MAG: S-ribosylhomocysteine lyase [Clostridiales bacterium]|nr:S-ribosylhomocysteine lyase [Clostridiales bacterium]
MEKIESFKINHLNLYSGLYVSRVDEFGQEVITTFDLRFTAPNREEPLQVPAMHTLEHIGATFFRNSKIKSKVVYFGPMGCRTGFYLLLHGNLSSLDILPLVKDFCSFVISFEGEIPGAKPEECGNYSEQDLNTAKIYAKKYLDDLTKYNRLKY